MNIEKIIGIIWKDDHYEKLKPDRYSNKYQLKFFETGRKYKDIRQVYDLRKTLSKQGYELWIDTQTEKELKAYEIRKQDNKGNQ